MRDLSDASDRDDAKDPTPADPAPGREDPASRVATLDPDFLLSDDMRGVRLQLEYEKTEHALLAAGIASTLVVFGSARAAEDGPGEHARWYSETRAFAHGAAQRRLAVEGGRAPHEWVIATGGGPGLMEAANRGAAEAGAPSIGFNIKLPLEQRANDYSTPSLTFRFHYFAVRKMHFAMRARALVVFPGGFGTLDETFEILTLRQTRKMPPCDIVLFDRAFWHRLVDFDLLVDAGMVDRADLDLITWADTADEALQALFGEGV